MQRVPSRLHVRPVFFMDSYQLYVALCVVLQPGCHVGRGDHCSLQEQRGILFALPVWLLSAKNWSDNVQSMHHRHWIAARVSVRATELCAFKNTLD